MHGPGDARIEDLDAPSVVEPTDAIIEAVATCICGSNLQLYRDLESSDGRLMDYEYVGMVTEVGDAAKNVKIGDFVAGSFCFSDNTCEIYRSGYRSRCVNGGFAQGTQIRYARISLADGTLVVVPGGRPKNETTLASLLAVSDILGASWFGAVTADADPGETIAVVGDGAVGLMTVLAAKQLGTERIVTMSCHEDRVALVREFGATDVIAERGDAGAATVKELTRDLGARGMVEAVDTQEPMMQIIGTCRSGKYVEYVDVSHDVSLPGQELFFTEVSLLGGSAPARRFLPDLIDRIPRGRIDLGRVFNPVLPLDGAMEGYKTIGERRTVKVLLQP